MVLAVRLEDGLMVQFNAYLPYQKNNNPQLFSVAVILCIFLICCVYLAFNESYNFICSVI